MAGTSSVPRRVESGRIAFKVQTIECIACAPAFGRRLSRLEGVTNVTELPITNKVVVEFDASNTDRGELEKKILEATKATGFGGRVIFER